MAVKKDTASASLGTLLREEGLLSEEALETALAGHPRGGAARFSNSALGAGKHSHWGLFALSPGAARDPRAPTPPAHIRETLGAT